MATRHQSCPVPGVARRPRPWARSRPAAILAGGWLAAASFLAVIPAGARTPGTTVADGPGTSVPAPSAPASAERSARDDAEAACLAAGGPRLDADALAAVPYPDRMLELADATVLDSRGAVLDNSERDRAGFAIAVRIRRGVAGRDLCFLGGSLRTGLDPETTSWDTWHRVTAMAVESPGFRVVGTAFRNEGDLMAFLEGADDWQVVGVRADGGTGLAGAYGHDDCIENDAMLSGLVVDSKFDGCFTFLSSTQASETPLDGSGNRVEVRGTLVRLQPYQNSFNVPKYGEGGHGGFFKWARTDSDVMVPPALTVSDSVFRADDPARYGGNENGFLGLPPGTRCERVVLIGTETWPADELASWQDQCRDLQLGTIADWDAAVAAWDAAHPPLRDLAGRARDLVAGAFGW